jgi:hypothetical protein
MISKELQLGKAGEHFVCYDLIYQGYNAFLADQGLPYDIIVDDGGNLLRVQVRSCQKLRDFPKSKSVYRFGTRKGKGTVRKIAARDVDIFAFVALDRPLVAYLPTFLLSKSDYVVQTVEFKTKQVIYSGRVYSNGTIRTPEWGRYIEDYGRFLWWKVENPTSK